jgi:predicted house-cleaning NTP pyrophosphatase (Maf/HAM1 superfamily)
MADLDLRGLPVVLGSSSKWRRSLFASRLPGLPFSTASADIDERAVCAGYADRGAAHPHALTLALAHAKADAIAPLLSRHALLITSDQVLSFNGRIREVRHEHFVARLCAVRRFD